MQRLISAAALSIALVAAAQAKDRIEENRETIYLARDFVFVDSPPIEGYLRSVCKRLLDAKGVQIDVPNILVQSSDAFNAFTDVQGNLVISTGALRSLESEDELAALLGHELSHLVLEHPQDKDAMRALPLGVETMSSMRDAAAQSQGRSDAQATSVLWSDFIAPSWNRKQEQEADENGFELMRAAGYDPSAFGQLFSKLQAAETKRSERMQVLKKALVVRLRDAAPATKVQSVALTDAVTDSASEKVIESLAAFNRSYDSPDERQAKLAAYAREHRQQKRSVRPDTRFGDVLQIGEGVAMIALDGAALNTLDAVARKNTVGAITAVAPLGGEAKLPSAHLNLALGSYEQAYGKQAYGKSETGAAAAEAWLLAAHPPAQAFLWSASYKVKARDYQGALDLLESGRRRVGDSAPFLPTLIATARASGNLALARDYTSECRAESGNVTQKLLGSEQNSLYAECVRQLGEKPTEDAMTDKVAGKARESVFNLLRKK